MQIRGSFWVVSDGLGRLLYQFCTLAFSEVMVLSETGQGPMEFWSSFESRSGCNVVRLCLFRGMRDIKGKDMY